MTVNKRRQLLEDEIEDLECQIGVCQDELEQIIDGEKAWPDMQTLLAVYGAPGKWPVLPSEVKCSRTPVLSV